jgi:CheY-like chemotaxis protein
VLVVEDNLVNQEVASELLERVGLRVETASDGARAVELVASRHFDLVLMDVQMPVMDGLSATRAIRQQGGARTPILAMTANAFGDDRAACLAAGMDDHVAKPVDPAALYGALLRWLPAVHDAATGAASATAGDAAARRADTTLLQRLRQVPGYDPEAALRSVGGHADVLARVLARFTGFYADGHDGLAGRQGAPSSEALRLISHSLRGACAAVGATALQHELLRFEQDLHALAEPAERQQRSQALQAQLLELVGHLQRALAG